MSRSDRRTDLVVSGLAPSAVRARMASATAPTPQTDSPQGCVRSASPSVFPNSEPREHPLSPAPPQGIGAWPLAAGWASTRPMSDGAIGSPQAGAKPDGYIPVRKAELAEEMAAAGGLPAEDIAAFPQVLKLLGALLHHEAH